MIEYGLHLESGPKRRKTMVHVFDLLGCMANGPTTEEALAATPAAISAYLRFRQRIGESVNAGACFTTRVVEHVTEGVWLGNGSPYAFFAPDLEPVSVEELETFLGRLHGLTEALAGWAESQTEADLGAIPGDGSDGSRDPAARARRHRGVRRDGAARDDRLLAPCYLYRAGRDRDRGRAAAGRDAGA